MPKIMVAVHGIGEQTAYETAQSVAFRVFGHFNIPPALPLGHFHTATPPIPGVITPGLMMLSNPPWPVPGQIGFADMYWADVPRDLVTKGFTLEEAKRWARTIIARLNFSAHRAGNPLSPRQYTMLRMVLEEMVDAVFVLENLCFLAERAGLFKFELKKLLNDFLNDVQVVTDFEAQRVAILQRFHALMGSVITRYPDAELYIVGHSEGSVVAFLGVLDGLSRSYQWARQVRGLMTIGSPIETHHLLWSNPQLWSPHPPAQPLPSPIEWWNYYDTGDPIAYRLDSTRDWLRTSGWQDCFNFPAAHDIEFARYPLAGKAHVDYWKDDGVFGHFIDHVVSPPPPNPPPGGRRARGVPQSKAWASAASVALPYLLVLALMFTAVFAIYKPVSTVLGVSHQPASSMARDLATFTLMLLGMTIVVRAPRLTRLRSSWFVWLSAAAIFVAGVFAYGVADEAAGFLVEFETKRTIETELKAGLDRTGWDAGIALLPLVVGVATALAALWSYVKPARGVRPLLVIGGAVVGMVVGFLVLSARDAAGAATAPAVGASTEPPAVWPVLLGSVFFLYLWWLATLILDLTIVWHSHVRWGNAIAGMRAMMTPRHQNPEPGAGGDIPSPA